MSKTLLITVGGSHQPIITAITSINPDRVIFICSDGPKGSLSQITGSGTPCEVRKGTDVISKLPNIPTQMGLGDRFNSDDIILLDNPDDLTEAYSAIIGRLRSMQQEPSRDEILVDYTGGTKTMSIALAMAAIDSGVTSIQLTTTIRDNLIKIERGESTERVSIAGITTDRALRQLLPSLLKQYNYPAAISQLQTIISTTELAPQQKQTLRQQLNLCRALDAWDRFDHSEAWTLFEPAMKQFQDLGLFLKRTLASRKRIDPTFENDAGIPGHGYEIIQDLLLNADRRASQQRYDDATGRLYRALELLAQIRLLQQYDIRTGDIQLEKLPETLRPIYDAQRVSHSGNKIMLTLTRSYELLTKLPDDPLGQLYSDRASRIQDALTIRNHSLFAHGFQPISRSDYDKVTGAIVTFIRDALDCLIPEKQRRSTPQFPQALLESVKSER